MVDWSLAGQIARFAAGSHRRRRMSPWTLAPRGDDASGPTWRPTPGSAARRSRPRRGASAAASGRGQPGRRCRPARPRGRAPRRRRLSVAGPLAGALRTAAGATLAAEAGLVMGYVSQRVLGQYELSLLAPERPPRLLFVAPEPRRGRRATRAWTRDSFLDAGSCVHELTHVFQFQGVPVAPRAPRRAHARVPRSRSRCGSTAAPPAGCRRCPARRARGASARAVSLALIQSREQRRIMDEIQAPWP